MKDPYYEPLLVFSGWRKVDDLENRTITVWSKEAVPPATPIDSPQRPLAWEGVLWGILPIGSSILAMLLVLIPDRRWAGQTVVSDSDKAATMPSAGSESSPANDDLVLGRIS